MSTARRLAALSALISGAVAWSSIPAAGVAAADTGRSPRAALPDVIAGASAAGPQTAVSLGDSFISGEGGRWWGNGDLAAAAFCTRGGTDRAAYRQGGIVCRYDPHRVYGATAVDGPNTGCHRSDVAEINSVGGIGLTPINLACSGAETKHIIDTPYKENKKAQSELLRDLLPTHTVKLIVLSIGGNDLNVSGRLRACIDSYMSGNRNTSCTATGVGKQVVDQLPAVAANVKRSIQKIKSVMAQGQKDAPYTFILQSYPSPVPAASRVRAIFPEANGGTLVKRTLAGGCPLWNADFDLMHNTLTPKIDDMLRNVARDEGVKFLSMVSAINGHALCEEGTRQSGPTEDAAQLGSLMEWVRFGVGDMAISQGYQQESFHPNAFAQRSQGRCLIAAYQSGATSCSPQQLAGSAQRLARSSAGNRSAQDRSE